MLHQSWGCLGFALLLLVSACGGADETDAPKNVDRAPGIQGTGLRAIQGTGVRGIEGSGKSTRGIQGSGRSAATQGIQGTGRSAAAAAASADGIQGTGRAAADDEALDH